MNFTPGNSLKPRSRSLTQVNDHRPLLAQMVPMPAELRSSCNAAPLSVLDDFAAALFPRGIAEPAQTRFEQLARLRSPRAGGAVLRDGTEDSIVFVAGGAMKLVAHAAGGREQVLAFHFPGDFVAVPAHGAHSYTLFALTSSEALVFPAAEFIELSSGHPAAMRTLLAAVLRSLNRSREKAIALGRKTAQERLSAFLIGMAERIGQPAKNACLLHLPMSRRDIADSLGLTIETVSRQLGELREAGLLETAGRSDVRLFDLAALAARAGHLFR